MMKRALAAVTLGLALMWANPAAAETVSFDVNGTDAGGAFAVDTFDWLPGNSLLVEDGTTTINGQVYTTATLYYQSNLNSLEGPGGTTFDPQTQCPAGQVCHFQAVAGVEVLILQLDAPPPGPSPSDTNVLLLDPTAQTNFFKIYASTADQTDLTGVCFVCGTEILSGTANFLSGNFTVNAFDAGALDGYLNNDWLGVNTIGGSGGTTITVTVDSFDINYFKNLIAGTSLTTTQTFQGVPYNDTDPSRCFDANGVDNGNDDVIECLAAVVGPLNGVSTNMTLAETDAKSSFRNVETVVPEPATLTLLGLGLAGSAAARRRQQKKAQAQAQAKA